MATQLRDRAKGRWFGLLTTLGLDARFLSAKHGPCPLCTQGKDRFRYDDKDGDGTWFCSKCGAGDGFMLLQKLHGWSFRDVAQRVEAIVGSIAVAKPKAQRPDIDKRAAMNSLWASATRVNPDDAVGRYLEARCKLSTFPSALRSAGHCRYQADPVTWHPAMIAMVTGFDGRPAILHRTYLTKDGRKADVEQPRRLMPGSIAKGCAVRLAKASGVLGIAEGIETALSASVLFGVPCWAAVNAGMLAAWMPPDEVQEVIVFGDNDASYAGQAAAYALAFRLKSHGMRVRVEIPSDPGLDWNDVHRGPSPSPAPPHAITSFESNRSAA